MDRSREKIKEYHDAIKTIDKAYTELAAVNNDGMPHSHNAGSDKFLNQIVRKDKEIDRVKRLIEREEKRIQEYSNAYIILSDIIDTASENERELINHYYFNNETRTETCYFLRIGTTTFKRWNGHLIEKIKNKLEEVD